MKEIFAVDFDGTLCEHKYPEIGSPNVSLIEALKKLRNDGARLILWTCRSGVDLTRAINWCSNCYGLEFDAVNDDIESVKLSDFGRSKSRKVFANFYIDDRNILPEHFVMMASIPTPTKSKEEAK